MPRITVGNLPVTTHINATVEVDDGPDHTLHKRIAEAALAGRWERAHGALAEEYEDLNLGLDERVLDRPLWSFDILAGGPATPPMGRLTMTYGVLPTREQFDAAWDLRVHATFFSFENDPRVGTADLTREALWAELEKAASYNNGSDRSREASDAAQRWCSDVLGILGIEWV